MSTAVPFECSHIAKCLCGSSQTSVVKAALTPEAHYTHSGFQYPPCQCIQHLGMRYRPPYALQLCLIKSFSARRLIKSKLAHHVLGTFIINSKVSQYITGV